MNNMKQITIIIPILFFVFINSMYAQEYTGPDQEICKGGCVVLGYDSDEDYCYKWTNKAGETLSTSSTLTACPEVSELYLLNITDGNGQLIAEEEVNVTVINEVLNLTIYDAKVFFINNQEYLPVSEEEEESIGAQTFVNLDNDDENKYFDNESEMVETEDDELIKLEISSSKKSVIVDAIEGEEYIKVFKKETKGEEYTLGTEIELEQDGGLYKGELWVEGIEAHTVQKATILELIATEDELACGERVAITIVGIESLEWLGNYNGFTPPNHEAKVLDIDPNFPAGTLKGYRVFPGARTKNTLKPRDVVFCYITLSVPFVRKGIFYVRTLDVDDPSEDTEFIDPNDHPLSLILSSEGKYSGKAGLTYTKENDNRGLINVGKQSYKFGYINGQDLNGIATVLISPNMSNIHLVFKVSHYAGDNYRLVANGDYDFLKNLRNRDKVDGLDIKDPKAGIVQEWEKYTSPVLTVWRLLHIESESMLNFKYELYTQQIFTYITDFKSANTDPTKIEEISVDVDLTNPTGSLLDPSVGGRFENGYVHFGVTSTNGSIDAGSITSGLIEENQEYNIKFKNPQSIQGLACEITNPIDGSILQATINNLTKINNDYKWDLSLPEEITLEPYLGGSIKIGDLGVSTIINSIEEPNMALTEEVYIPIVVRDDDRSPTANILPHQLDLSITISAFGKAYVLPVNDGGGLTEEEGGNVNELSFKENYDSNGIDFNNDINNFHHSKTKETPFFWIAYISSGWQDHFLADGDNNQETFLNGLTYSIVHNEELKSGGNGSMVFMETQHDYMLNSPSVQKMPEPNVIAHEIGHQFGLSHGDDADNNGDGIPDYGPAILEYPNIGLMKSGKNELNSVDIDYFIPRHINLIRSRRLGPGQ